MTETGLYYALSTIAQCAAALAALIGFLSLWRLDRLRDEERQLEDEIIAVMMQLRDWTQATTALVFYGRAQCACWP